ncbi:MAG: glycine cleavage system protein GcvH [Planctomycetaceae bacterium]|nr:glycine cleavage system protein GcvH [Planctomycetaceae bacterium]
MDPQNLRFAKTHEWVSVEGDVATIGISDFAVKLLTDIVFLELPSVGTDVQQAETIGEIESVKAVSDLYAPVSGTIVEVNESLPDDLSQLSDSPFDAAWIARIRMNSPDQVDGLLNYSDYQAHCESGGH